MKLKLHIEVHLYMYTQMMTWVYMHAWVPFSEAITSMKRYKEMQYV